jgi:hypothetical protein
MTIESDYSRRTFPVYTLLAMRDFRTSRVPRFTNVEPGNRILLQLTLIPFPPRKRRDIAWRQFF